MGVIYRQQPGLTRSDAQEIDRCQGDPEDV